MTQARDAFAIRYKGHRNVMSPNVTRYGVRRGLAYELSWGQFMGGRLWGVTVLRLDDPQADTHDLNRSFATLEAANAYIEELGK